MPEVFVSPENDVEKKNLPDIPTESKHGLFSAFRFHPKNVNFETKEKEEKIILMLRQHPIVNLGWIIISIILFLCPAVVEKTGLLTLLPTGYPLVIKLAWYLVTFAYAMEGFFGWYFNVFFVTTRRVIDVDFFNLINKRVSDAEIEKIQDVSYSTSGPIGTIFNFGDVLIQTAAEMQELSFERVPSPEKVAGILDKLREDVH
jgi:hypothetical protein